jgi:outer membrane protein assembly factor BamB
MPIKKLKVSRILSAKVFCLVISIAFLLSLSISVQPSFLVHGAVGTDVAVAGQDLTRQFYSPDSAPNSPNLLWKFPLGGPPGLYSTIAVGGVVYQGSLGTGDVYAINETTGVQIWHVNVNNTQESLTYYNGLIYTQGGSLPYDTQLRSFGDLWLALNASTGATVWTYKIPRDEWMTPNIGSYGGPPIIVNGKMYIPVFNGTMALNALTGAIIDRWDLVNTCFYGAYSNGDVFTITVNQTSGLFYAVRANLDNHTIEWMSHDSTTAPLGHNDVGAGLFSALCLSGDLFVNEYNFSSGEAPNHIFRINAQDGTLAWQFNIVGYPIGVTAAYNNLYVGTSSVSSPGNVYAVDKAEGTTPIWTFKAGPVVTPLVAADDKIFFGSEDSYIYALDALTGQLIWKYRTGGPIVGAPIIANDKLFVASRDGVLYAFGTPLPKPTSALTLTNPSSVNLGQSVSINGRLVDDANVGLVGANVTLQQRLVPRIDWTNITSVTTDSNGNFNYAWTPNIPAYYDLQAIYAGDGLAPSSHVSLVNVAGPSPTVDLSPLMPYLLAIILLNVVLVGLMIFLISSRKRS